MAIRNMKFVTFDCFSESSDDGLGPQWKIWRRRRYVVAYLALLGFMNVYSLRVNLSIAIVAMTNNYNVTLENGTVVEMEKDFDWDTKQIGLALSAFFYGYILTQVPGGWLAAKVGGAKLFVSGIAATALLTVVTPPLTKINFYVLLAIRIIEGFFEGVTFPCIHAVWSKWAPPLERSKLATIAFSGSFIGTVISMPLSGLIANVWGWEAIFYIFGAVGLAWCALWLAFVKEAPRYDPYITKEELNYIESSIGSSPDARVKHPWGQILKSPPVWAIVTAHFSENWGFYTLLTQLPSFMNDTLNYKVEKAGFMSAVPYLVMATVLQFSGHIADYLRSRKILSTTNVRKLFNCTAFLSQTVFMILAASLTTPAGIIACLSVAVGLGGFAWCGFGVNHLDIAPQHAGVLMGFSNTFGTLPGMLSPIITGYIVHDKSAANWKKVFYITSGVYLVGALAYGIFASGEKQPWAEPKENGVDDEKTKDEGLDNRALQLDKSGN
ncbi:sialin, putative [Pediculus humanus corporis]|uniref:Sialin n=1 Tax=Pediculus humanus subsp. corporis TaxID=121224 RepID=E0W365_PEDHC|nr:sialin, putative [Pediculus humanus corporis]EEB20071.1 sialin, putative [Pediculus humanus corporis]